MAASPLKDDSWAVAADAPMSSSAVTTKIDRIVFSFSCGSH
jgi:hypothetical protein